MRKVLKWTGLVLGGLLVLLVIAGVSFYFVGSSNVAKTYDVQTASLAIPTDSASLARGAHLVQIFGCVDCHGQDLSGQVMVDAPPFRAVPANLTSGKGGLGSIYTAEDFDRAIRHGVKKDGTSVLIMPSKAYHRMADTDIAAIIAHLKTLPAVDNELPKTEYRTAGLLMSALVFDPAFEVRSEPARAGTPPPEGPTAEYGAYLADLCGYCHGENLRGAQPPMPDSPFAPDLAAAGKWTIDQFKHTLRTGERPGREPLQKEYMPYEMTARMTDVELEAIHAHLATLVN